MVGKFPINHAESDRTVGVEDHVGHVIVGGGLAYGAIVLTEMPSQVQTHRKGVRHPGEGHWSLLDVIVVCQEWTRRR